MGKRCKLGKSCGATCINRLDRCVLEIGEVLKESLSKFKNFVYRLVGKHGSKGEPQPPQPLQPVSIPEGSYKVRGGDKVGGSRESKNALNNAFKGGKGKSFLRSSIADGKLYSYDKADREIKEIAKGQLKQNKEFMGRLGNNLPENVKILIAGQIIQMSFKTDSGDRVAVYFSPKRGFHFNVNGSDNAGTVKTREGQIQVASAVRSLYNATVRSLPEGSVIRTRAHMADGLGESRIKIYNKLGFSLPTNAGGDMFGVVGPNNTVTPSSREAWKEQGKLSSSVFFSEN